jgi:hypothetical protein
LSGIQLAQFYGIEIDDFAGEIAKLALWLAEHQMNVAFFNEFGRTNPTLPLKEAGKIIQGNATRLDWEVVCPKNEGDEIYILGNPPYLGFSVQQKEQKEDMKIILGSTTKLDYISCWFLKSSRFALDNTNIKYAFVSTNSINQGEQVELLWPLIFNNNQEIAFCVKDFKWKNNAKGKAAVICSIIGLSNSTLRSKKIYNDSLEITCTSISAYLVPGQSDLLIRKRKIPLSDFPNLALGNMAKDGGGLFMSNAEKSEFISNSPHLEIFIKRSIGSYEFLNDIMLWCLWINEIDYTKIKGDKFLEDRLDIVRIMRSNSKKKQTKEFTSYPYRFIEIRHQKTESILIPRVSSERRTYIPLGYISKDTVVKDSAYAVYNATPSLFGLLTSKMHMVWVQVSCGRLKSDYRYSSQLCYNTFPFPPISTQRKNEITQSVLRILGEREKHSDKTLADLYDPDKMPEGLREAHRQNDEIIERCYRSTPFNSDEERLEYLFKLYEKMIAEEQAQGTLFAKPKKTRKKKK